MQKYGRKIGAVLLPFSRNRAFPCLTSHESPLRKLVSVVCCRQTIVCSCQTHVCSQQTMVCLDQTKVARDFTFTSPNERMIFGGFIADYRFSFSLFLRFPHCYLR